VAAIPLAEGACSAFSYSGTTLPQDRFPLIVSAGRISPMKGQDLLVRALPAIREAFPNVLCVFAGRIGSGSGLEDTDKFSVDLTRQVKRLGLESNVIFAGEVENLPDLLRRAAIYVQPSRTESFGRVVAESLLCGIPVAGFEVGGISESGGPGVLLVPPLDVPALSKAIIRVLEAPALARELAREGSAHVKRHFEPGAVAERFFSLVAQASPGAALQERPAWTRS
jgi:glycosyltransferase involved in cell wall biosynthesis